MSQITSLKISLDQQTLDLIKNGELVRQFSISSAEKGMGFTEGSFRTPVGRFRISEKIGDGEPIGTRFVARVPVGVWEGGEEDEDMILTRILRIEGLEAENSNTMDRYVYIHGTNQESKIGHPSSHGCIRLANQDMLELFDAVEVGSELEIDPLTRKGPKLLFIDCDSTLSEIEGIDELARLANPAIFAEVVALTNSAMDGEVDLDTVFKRRMEIIKPNRSMIDRVSQCYLDTVVPGAEDFVNTAISEGWIPVILSGGFAPIIQPLADYLGIRHVEAVPLYFNESGEYTGFGENYPTTRNLGKNEIIRQWKEALLPERVVMVGDGISDLETKPEVDMMAGFGVVVHRSKVKEGSDIFVESYEELKGRIFDPVVW
ncbi:HAD-IB family phosphatase [Luteolibacter sp. AS25]|uniref:HAD-IB family phosphatase n=1 Tax=Luteolibacter sp. AS25 TaxID=3135776 RepID=UPI00398AFC9C